MSSGNKGSLADARDDNNAVILSEAKDLYEQRQQELPRRARDDSNAVILSEAKDLRAACAARRGSWHGVQSGAKLRPA
jgi:pyruvate/2-oxoglutarate/acetoin dehydrogenase E1 component